MNIILNVTEEAAGVYLSDTRTQTEMPQRPPCATKIGGRASSDTRKRGSIEARTP